ncbi:MAG TPA: formate dehydrogenase accessory sulfurtransferase FdhD [Desulfotignum sp.]|nr:formate dehydrogenase accessory sulfurtransferase FdhD [Desulfotignum sp.]
MGQKKDTQPFTAWVVRQEGRCTPELELIGEEPFLIRVEDHAYSVVMRTPGDEVCHAMGFCLGEGLVNTPADIRTIGYDPDLDPNVVDIWLTPERRRKVASLLQRKTFISQTSCGICGKEMMKDIQTRVKPAPDGFTFTLEQALYCIDLLSSSQKYRQRTRGSHAAMLCDENLSILGFAEDVGRHNGLDKAVGQAFQAGTLGRARILVLSSRISYELVQKAARARIPVIIANSRPTALAARMGSSLNMTLSFPTGEDHLMVVCGEKRLVDT